MRTAYRPLIRVYSTNGLSIDGVSATNRDTYRPKYIILYLSGIQPLGISDWLLYPISGFYPNLKMTYMVRILQLTVVTQSVAYAARPPSRVIGKYPLRAILRAKCVAPIRICPYPYYTPPGVYPTISDIFPVRRILRLIGIAPSPPIGCFIRKVPPIDIRSARFPAWPIREWSPLHMISLTGA